MTAPPLEYSSTPRRDSYDAVIVGSGPNGLAAAITIAKTGRSVLVMEAAPDIGGGMRSRELTGSGFIHDVCSAVHPLGVASRFFRDLPLADFGLEWIHPEASVAHALDVDTPVVMYPSLEQTAAGLGADGPRYMRLLAPFVERADELLEQLLAPFTLFPRSPLLLLRFGLRAMRSATGLARGWFREDAAPALFAGLAAHSLLPLEHKLTAGVGMLFAVMGHMRSWPIARGGSQAIADALVGYLRSLGGEVITNSRVTQMSDLPPAKAYLFDTIPRTLSRVAGDALPQHFRNKLEAFRHGPGVYKVDWALDGPIPWRHDGYKTAATVHIGGTMGDVAAAERAPWQGECAQAPFILLSQQSLFDSTRAPAGKHVVWSYCHAPSGTTVDMTERIAARIEQFAPGFRDRVIARHVMDPAAMESHNANYPGGDITGGVMDLRQAFSRPVSLFNPYGTPAPQLFLCSASTPPGAGVHGMCGYFAAQAALKRVLR